MDTKVYQLLQRTRNIKEAAIVGMPASISQDAADNMARRIADNKGLWKETEATTYYEEAKRLEDTRPFGVSRERDVAEFVIVYADSAEEACEIAESMHWTEWEPVDSYCDNYEADEVNS